MMRIVCIFFCKSRKILVCKEGRSKRASINVFLIDKQAYHRVSFYTLFCVSVKLFFRIQGNEFLSCFFVLGVEQVQSIDL